MEKGNLFIMMVVFSMDIFKIIKGYKEHIKQRNIVMKVNIKMINFLLVVFSTKTETHIMDRFKII